MDTKKLKNKHNKKALKSKPNSGDAEVFVLPPDLLLKLGINLGMVKSDQEYPLETSVKIDYFGQEQIKNVQSVFSSSNNQTISETASLLKESMLLTGSPTLIPTEPKISGEIEISNGAVQENNATKYVANTVSHIEKSEINGLEAHHSHTDNLNGIIQKETDIFLSGDKRCTSSVDEKVLCMGPNDSTTSITAVGNICRDKDENKNYYEITDGNKRLLKDRIRSKVIKKYEHFQEVEANISNTNKQSNDYVENNTKQLNTSVNLLNDSQMTSLITPITSATLKSSIMTENIEGSSKFSDVKILSNRSITNLPPIKLDSVITENNTANLKKAEPELDTLNNKKYLPSSTSFLINEINREISEKCDLHYIVHNSFNNNKQNVSNLAPSAGVPNGGCLNFLDTQKYINNKNEHKSIDIDNLKYNECNQSLVVNNKVPLNVEQQIITANSKLCFQGVEKPGGEQYENTPKIVKTYKKCKRLTKPVVHNLTKSTNEAGCDSHELGTENVINAVISQDAFVYREFCVCEDFGTLNFYDDIKEYEHIHFWNRDTTCVDPELIISMYNDKYCNIIADDCSFSTNIDTKEISDKTRIRFCWSEFLCKEKDNTKSELSDLDSCCDQKNVGYSIDHSKELRIDKSIPISNDIDNAEFHINTMNEDNNTELLKGKTNNYCSSLIISDDSKTTDGLKQSIPANDNIKVSSESQPMESKEISSDSLLKDVETPTPKRRRGRPRKHIQPTLSVNENEESVDTELADINKTSVESLARGKRGSKTDPVSAADKDLTKKVSQRAGKGNDTTNALGEDQNATIEEITPRTRKRRDALDNSVGQTKLVIENNRAHLKRKKSCHDLSLTDVNDSQPMESKEISSESLLANISKDVETPTPKRRRGRPRKHIQPTLSANETVHSKQTDDATLADINKTPVQSSELVNRDSKTDTTSSPLIRRGSITTSTPAKCQTIEETTSNSKHNDNTDVTTEFTDNKQNEESILSSSKCTERTSRNTSSHSMSESNEDNNAIAAISENDEDVQCGVCDVIVKSSAWIHHIAKEHDYLAWKKGSKPLDLNDELEVKSHLQNILKEVPVLICHKCGIRRKYILSYLKHIKTCESTGFQMDANMSIDSEDTVEPDFSLEICEMNVSLKDSQDEVRCGVCSKDVKGTDWIVHIQREHYYLAWAEGQTSLNVNDAVEVQKYLMALAKKLGGLICHKCRLIRKYANIYLQHVKTCDVPEVEPLEDKTPIMPCSGDKVRCAVCLKEVEPLQWKQHAMKKHYNIAWIAGEPPIDVKNFYVVETYLKEYKNNNNKLVCRVCGDSKVSYCGFYAHIIQCGKTEEEYDKYKELCNICNKKYLCIYKNQHMTMHRAKEYAMERKLKLAELKEQAERNENIPIEGRRRAAEKAKIVIAKYKDEIKTNAQKDGTEYANGYSSDSDVSVKLEQYTDDESDCTDENSHVSGDEYLDERKKKRLAESNPLSITRIPFTIKNAKSYIQDSFDDFCKNHLTKETLFSEWTVCEYEKLCEDQVNKYIPSMEQSCKVNIAHEGWSRYKRFEVKINDDCISLFVGASIQCVSWAPIHLDDINGGTGNFLAVACHSGMDSPRYNCDEAAEHSNLLQIWDFGDIQYSRSTAKLALGLAHDYGTIWAMDWCPSGTRDLPSEENSHCQRRLGLLAIACSNGSAYIFPVPYPSTMAMKDHVFHKIKPVAELRLSSMLQVEKKYQATSLRWSSQKGHNIIMVGYSDGTVAYFDINNDSLLLVSKENSVTVLYPFYDERSHNSCVTGVDLYPGGASIWRGGAASSASSTGAHVLTGAPTRDSGLQSSLACAGAFFLPHWPSVVLTSVNSKVNQMVNEMEWQSAGGAGGAWVGSWRGCGGGRRVGAARARAACARCGALAAGAEPLLALLHAHPAHRDISKHVAAIIEMTPLTQKRKQTNDELAMKIEPLTYDDAIQKYGIEFQLASRKNKDYQQKALATPILHYPERFPLAEITSMAFCPTAANHNTIAVGTHGGILFIFDV